MGWDGAIRIRGDFSTETLISERKQKPNYKPKTNHIDHTGYVNTVMLFPDGSLCASADEGGQPMLWDLNALCLSPNCYWLCAATGPTIKIWDLRLYVWGTTVDKLKQEVTSTSSKAEPPHCPFLVWCADGQTPRVTQTTWCECGMWLLEPTKSLGQSLRNKTGFLKKKKRSSSQPSLLYPQTLCHN